MPQFLSMMEKPNGHQPTAISFLKNLWVWLFYLFSANKLWNKCFAILTTLYYRMTTKYLCGLCIRCIVFHAFKTRIIGSFIQFELSNDNVLWCLACILVTIWNLLVISFPGNFAFGGKSLQFFLKLFLFGSWTFGQS